MRYGEDEVDALLMHRLGPRIAIGVPAYDECTLLCGCYWSDTLDQVSILIIAPCWFGEPAKTCGDTTSYEVWQGAERRQESDSAVYRFRRAERRC